MTTKQTIDGVPRKLVRENIAYLRGVGGTYDQKSALAAKFELLLLDPAPPKELREQYEAWADANGYDITRNEHGDYAGIVEDSMWTGWQALGELRALLDKTEADIPASVPQGEPVAWRSCAAINGKHYITEDSPDQQQERIDKSAPGAYLLASEPLYLGTPDQDAAMAAQTLFRFKVIEDASVPPGQIHMCDCNQGRMPCNGKCTPTS